MKVTKLHTWHLAVKADHGDTLAFLHQLVQADSLERLSPFSQYPEQLLTLSILQSARKQGTRPKCLLQGCA